MTAVHKLPVEFKPPEDGRRAPVVTVIGSNLPAAYLEEAEPSPLMGAASRLWQRILRVFKLIAVVVLVCGYPTAIMMSHRVNSSPVILSYDANWASPEVGTALTLIGRELTEARWAEDRPGWHPQARLKALPAWQEGIITSISDHAALSAALVEAETGRPEADMLAAARLLSPVSEGAAIPRLNAAAEALQRYDGRLLRGVVTSPAGIDVMQQKLDLYIRWGTEAETALKTVAADASGWPASRADIEAVYLARARAHVAGQMLQAALDADPGLIQSRESAEARDTALQAWRRAAAFNPLFVSSQAGTGRFLSDHPATMAFYMAEAADASRAFKAKISAQQKGDMTVAAAPASPAP